MRDNRMVMMRKDTDPGHLFQSPWNLHKTIVGGGDVCGDAGAVRSGK